MFAGVGRLAVETFEPIKGVVRGDRKCWALFQAWRLCYQVMRFATAVEAEGKSKHRTTKTSCSGGVWCVQYHRKGNKEGTRGIPWPKNGGKTITNKSKLKFTIAARMRNARGRAEVSVRGWVHADPIPTSIILNDLQEMNQYRCRSLFTKQNLTLSISNTSLNPGSRTAVKATAPSNSRLTLANLPAIHQSLLPRSVTKVSVVLLAAECKARLGRIVDKRGDVASRSRADPHPPNGFQSLLPGC